MNIKINHIAKIEGHAGFMAKVINGDVKSAKLEVQEGIRLIEGILVGRHFKDMPIIAQRICGICPVVHNLTSIQAIEKALKIKVSVETINLRKLLEWGQIIHSHGLHLFFLSLADFLDIENDLILTKKYPTETKKIIQIREFGLLLIKIIGGRAIHPLTNEPGGFKKVPTIFEIQELIKKGKETLSLALELGEFFSRINVPTFSKISEYVCLGKEGEYAIYNGDIISNQGLHIPLEKFENNFHEIQKPREIIKRVQSDMGGSYMVGAIARINNQHDKLLPKAKKYLKELGYKFPDYNPFHNVAYQMVEIIHFVEESIRLLNTLVNSNLENALTKEYKIQEGSGVGAIEAPRGTLYYRVDIGLKGYVKKVNIITPTAQFLSHLEDNAVIYLSQLPNLTNKQKEKKMRTLIRAYDPCVSCAVH
ncbi:MAG: Ni/Fe hydrogenase subunit alpha [bacterium]|nr:Ni/Fe hydrogenase subunit alpha [bacterium]